MNSSKGCVRSCTRNNLAKGESTGYRGTFFYPAGGTYKGYWLNSKHERYGLKTNKELLSYDGEWHDGKRHGHGTMRKPIGSGYSKRIYVGEWRDDKKCGEGKQYYSNGIYYGFWKNNRRHGLGMMWYNDGSMYMGQWEVDVKHGVGTQFYSNGNRYEGHYARGLKNGEGTFFHLHTGQIQKGMWENNVCKTSLVVDADFRNQADKPTEYPIPRCGLADPDEFVAEIFHKYMENADIPARPFYTLDCLKFVQQSNKFAGLYPKAVSQSKLPFYDVNFPITCKK